MKITIDVYDMKERFKAMNRDYYTYEGLEMLLNYYDEIDENIEFDPIAICCDCTEFGENAAFSFDDLINDYSYLYKIEEWLEDNALERSEFDQDLYIESLVEHLGYETTVLSVPNGNYIIFTF